MRWEDFESKRGDRQAFQAHAEVQFLEFCFEWLPQSRPGMHRHAISDEQEALQASCPFNSCEAHTTAGAGDLRSLLTTRNALRLGPRSSNTPRGSDLSPVSSFLRPLLGKVRPPEPKILPRAPQSLQLPAGHLRILSNKTY